MVIHEYNVYKTGYLAASGMSMIKSVEMAQSGSFCNVSSLQSGRIALEREWCARRDSNPEINIEIVLLRESTGILLRLLSIIYFLQ
jgi:hypothetical protein